MSAWRGLAAGTILGLAVCGSLPALAADLYADGGWPALASDRTAGEVGDILTVIIFENSVASNSAQTTSRKDSRLAGEISAGDSLDESGELALSSRFEGTGQTGRTGKIVAQMSVVVDEVLPNGDLRVSGEQILNIDGDRTRIKLKGRVRRADISGGNTVLSTRLADVLIDYDGRGFVSRSGTPGIVTRILSFLGLV